MESKEVNKPIRLHDCALLRQGARQVLMKLHDDGLLCLENDKNKAYTEAVYVLLMSDENALFDWLAGLHLEYYGHEHDKKGKVVKCNARIAK